MSVTYAYTKICSYLVNRGSDNITGCIHSWKTWKSHGVLFSFSRPGKVMEYDSRFWKIHKSHGNHKASSCESARFGSSFKSCTSSQEYWFVQREIKNRFNHFHHILFKLTPDHTGFGLSYPPSLPRYMYLTSFMP